uniref:Uncharacterized protein n=1 Tax=Octopus bimaculoides TaxID=37653 RepID=A0A0L8FX53_OCTBM
MCKSLLYFYLVCRKKSPFVFLFSNQRSKTGIHNLCRLPKLVKQMLMFGLNFQRKNVTEKIRQSVKCNCKPAQK